MAINKVADVTTKVVGLLEPLTSEERRRVVDAAMTLLGEVKIETPDPHERAKERQDGSSQLPPRARAWLQQSGLSIAQLEQVFQIESGQVELIAANIPGNGEKERMLNIYVLTGIARLLASGDPAFDDRTAREATEHHGCYNDKNHARYMKDRGNRFTGSKEQGWRLTSPGLLQGAVLVRALAGGEK